MRFWYLVEARCALDGDKIAKHAHAARIVDVCPRRGNTPPRVVSHVQSDTEYIYREWLPTRKDADRAIRTWKGKEQ